jgi:hypothetical protein
MPQRAKTISPDSGVSSAAKAEREKSPAPTPSGAGVLKIPFPKPDPTNLTAMSKQPIWTGRNGTFTGYALEAMRANDNIMLSPIGKRGVGNCCIQFPISVIPALVDWLEEQSKGTTK